MDERQHLPLLGLPTNCRRGGPSRGAGSRTDTTDPGAAVMIPFRYSRAGSVREACSASSEPTTVVLAGGTELLNWMRLGVNAPEHLVDIKAVGGLS
ncbi:FAD binding domain-containing protein, partial [Pseudonocardia sp.]|uniref:FAD binding domain-containing protein n=1 Tax=Pseudonocardia sp. TaxID=60912 RepID=UPI0039C9BE23